MIGTVSRLLEFAGRYRFGQLSFAFFLCSSLIVLSLVLGGGTRTGFLSDAILQAASIPLLLFSLWTLIDLKPSQQMRHAWMFCLAIVLVPLVQLLPLPPQIWTSLPNRELSAETFTLLERSLPWMPISVSPHATRLSALSLLPPVAVFLGSLLLTYHERRFLSLVILAVGIVSVFLGLIQVAQGPSSQFRFFEITNATEAVGFFANRNHFAALLYALLLFAAAWLVSTANSARETYDTPSIVTLLAGFTIIVVLIAGQAIARSRGGLGLTVLALFGAFGLALSDRRTTVGKTSTKLLLGAIVLAVILVVQFALLRILQRFDVDPLSDARITFAHNTAIAAKAFMPFGSGMGSFVPVYALFESPQDLLSDTYANRAHNDILELWLEAGAMGIVLMALFVMWWVRRSIEIWRRAPTDGAWLDVSLARAATIVISLLVVHSFVDYPLRTAAIMTVMAFACALLLEPALNTEVETPTQPASSNLEGRPTKQRRTRSPGLLEQPSRHTVASSAAEMRRARERWGEDVEWPAEWREPPVRRHIRDATESE